MGFYGNMTTPAPAQFVFDRIYSNRAEMEANTAQDQVFAGKFVLIKYDSIYSNSIQRRAYRAEEDTLAIQNGENETNARIHLFSDNACDNIITIRKLAGSDGLIGIHEGTIFYVIEEDGTYTFYICDSSDATSEDGDDATFVKWQDSLTEIPDYLINYNIDLEAYQDENGQPLQPQGYDSTVWMKMYTNNTQKYVQIASLNTIAPSFGIAADAPTSFASTPHFDPGSSNMYYKLHIQPTWGMRVKAAQGELLSTDNQTMPSDETTTWIQSSLDENGIITYYYYDEAQQTWVVINDLADIPQVSAAIYYNRAGFSADTRYHSSLRDKIDVSPTGYSQKIKQVSDGEGGTTLEVSDVAYNKHNGTGATEKAPDTQEISMILPSIGNAISNMWDIVYGDGSEDPEMETLELIDGGTTPTDLSLDDFKNPVYMRVADVDNGIITYEETTATKGTRVIYEPTNEEAGTDSNVYAWYYDKWNLVGTESDHAESVRIYSSPYLDENGQVKDDCEIPRNTDIDWDSKAGLRLVKYDSETNAYTYDTEKIKTLAGCINSVHDLMGMIIVNEEDIDNLTPSQIALLDENKIYYNQADQKYYRKILDYRFNLISDEDKAELLKSQYTKIYFVEEIERTLNDAEVDNDIRLFDENLESITKEYYFNKNQTYVEDKLYYEADIDSVKTLDFHTDESLDTYYNAANDSIVQKCYWFNEENDTMIPITVNSTFFPITYYVIASGDGEPHYIYRPNQFLYDQTEEKVLYYRNQNTRLVNAFNTAGGILLTQRLNNETTQINGATFDAIYKTFVFGSTNSDWQELSFNDLSRKYGTVAMPEPLEGSEDVNFVTQSIFARPTQFETDLQNTLDALYPTLCSLQSDVTVPFNRYKYTSQVLEVGDSVDGLYTSVDSAIRIYNMMEGVTYLKKVTVQSLSNDLSQYYTYNESRRRCEQASGTFDPETDDVNNYFQLVPQQDLIAFEDDEEYYVAFTGYVPAAGTAESGVTYYSRSDNWLLQNNASASLDNNLKNLTNLYEMLKVLIELTYYNYYNYSKGIQDFTLDAGNSATPERTYYNKDNRTVINDVVNFVSGTVYYYYNNSTGTYKKIDTLQDLMTYDEDTHKYVPYLIEGTDEDSDIYFSQHQLELASTGVVNPLTYYYRISTENETTYTLNQNRKGFAAAESPEDNFFYYIDWIPCEVRGQYVSGRYLKESEIEVNKKTLQVRAVTNNGVTTYEYYDTDNLTWISIQDLSQLPATTGGTRWTVFVLDLNPTYTAGANYYVFKPTYYLGADFYPYTKGQILNNSAILELENLEAVPIATREAFYNLQPIEGLAVDINTMHGLILKINQMLDFGNTITRNTNTVQGALNTLNDEIARISNYNIDYVNHMSETLSGLGQDVNQANSTVIDIANTAQNTYETLQKTMTDIGDIDLIDDRIDEIENLIGVEFVSEYEICPDVTAENFNTYLGGIYYGDYSYTVPTEYDEGVLYYDKTEVYARAFVSRDEYNENVAKNYFQNGTNYYYRSDLTGVNESTDFSENNIFINYYDNVYKPAKAYQEGINYYRFNPLIDSNEFNADTTYILLEPGVYGLIKDTIVQYYYKAGEEYTPDNTETFNTTREYYVKQDQYRVTTKTVTEQNLSEVYIATGNIDPVTGHTRMILAVSPLAYNPDMEYFTKEVVTDTNVDDALDYHGLYDINDNYYQIQNFYYGKRHKKTVSDIATQIKPLELARNEWQKQLEDYIAQTQANQANADNTKNALIAQNRAKLDAINSTIATLLGNKTRNHGVKSITLAANGLSIKSISYYYTSHSNYLLDYPKDDGSIAYSYHKYYYNKALYDAAIKKYNKYKKNGKWKKKLTKTEKARIKAAWKTSNVTAHLNKFNARKNSYITAMKDKLNYTSDIQALENSSGESVAALNQKQIDLMQEKIDALNAQIAAIQTEVEAAEVKNEIDGGLNNTADMIDWIFDLYNYCTELDAGKFGIDAEEVSQSGMDVTTAVKYLTELRSTFEQLNSLFNGLQAVNNNMASKYGLKGSSNNWALALLELMPYTTSVASGTYKINPVTKSKFKSTTKTTQSKITFSGTVTFNPRTNIAHIDMYCTIYLPKNHIIAKGKYIPVGTFSNGPYNTGGARPLLVFSTPNDATVTTRTADGFVSSKGVVGFRTNVALGAKKKETKYGFWMVGDVKYNKGYDYTPSIPEPKPDTSGLTDTAD